MERKIITHTVSRVCSWDRFVYSFLCDSLGLTSIVSLGNRKFKTVSLDRVCCEGTNATTCPHLQLRKVFTLRYQLTHRCQKLAFQNKLSPESNDMIAKSNLKCAPPLPQHVWTVNPCGKPQILV